MRLSPEPGHTLTVSADFLAVRELAKFLHERCGEQGIQENVALDLELALVEAANNVVAHGYAGNFEGTMSLEVQITANALRLVLSDCGKAAPEGFFDACNIMDLDSESGRGNGIIHACVDEIRYSSNEAGNRLEMTRRR